MLAGPSPEHWAGTDNLGRDILARVLVATRLSVVLALSATAVAVGVGLAAGLRAHAGRPSLGGLLIGAVNIAVAFPGLLLALFFAVIFGVGAMGAVLAIGLAGAPAFARLCQTLIAGVGERDFIDRGAHRGRGPRPTPGAPRAAQHRRAPRRQRHHRRRRRPAGLRRAVVPRPRRAGPCLRLGPAAAGRPGQHLRPARGSAGARRSPSSWRGSPSTSSARPSPRASALSVAGSGGPRRAGRGSAGAASAIPAQASRTRRRTSAESVDGASRRRCSRCVT